MQKELYDVVVVGAGIVGCSVAYHLGRAAPWIGRWIPADWAKPECARIMDRRRALS